MFWISYFIKKFAILLFGSVVSKFNVEIGVLIKERGVGEVVICWTLLLLGEHISHVKGHLFRAWRNIAHIPAFCSSWQLYTANHAVWDSSSKHSFVVISPSHLNNELLSNHK